MLACRVARIIGGAAKSSLNIDDCIAIAMIWSRNCVVVRDGDQPRPEIDKGQDSRLGQQGYWPH